jgi:hypothetical protein
MRMSGPALRSCGWPAPAAAVSTRDRPCDCLRPPRVRKSQNRPSRKAGSQTLVTQTLLRHTLARANIARTSISAHERTGGWPPRANGGLRPRREQVGVLPTVEQNRTPNFHRFTSSSAFLPR